MERLETNSLIDYEVQLLEEEENEYFDASDVVDDDEERFSEFADDYIGVPGTRSPVAAVTESGVSRRRASVLRSPSPLLSTENVLTGVVQAAAPTAAPFAAPYAAPRAAQMAAPSVVPQVTRNQLMRQSQLRER